MPLFHFNIQDDVPRPDPDGLDLPDKDAAWAEAVRCCGEVLRELDGNLSRGSEWRMEVINASGQPVFTLRFLATEHPAVETEAQR